mgnify:FL=1
MNLVVFLLIIGLLLFNIKLSRRGAMFYWFFELSHFLMGFLIASLTYLTFSTNNITVILCVIASSVLWEFWEYVAIKFLWLNNFIKKLFNYHIDKQTFNDTLLDLILDLSGAIFFIV